MVKLDAAISCPTCGKPAALRQTRVTHAKKGITRVRDSVTIEYVCPDGHRTDLDGTPLD